MGELATEIDNVWAEESLQRSRACDEGRMELMTFEEVFGSKFSSEKLPEGNEND